MKRKKTLHQASERRSTFTAATKKPRLKFRRGFSFATAAAVLPR
jgi:hypothetical protein